MDLLPIQLSFFKKLELYQELQRLDKQQAQNPASVWSFEKRILRWTVSNHHHLGTPIGNAFVVEHILPDLKSNGALVLRVMENLIEREYAQKVSGPSGSVIWIKFTPAGRLMGDVIDDTESDEWWPRNSYRLMYIGVWVVILAAIATALSVLAGVIIKVIYFLFWSSSGGHHWGNHT